MSTVNYLIANPDQTYISPSADSNIENNTGWIAINGSTMRLTQVRPLPASNAAGVTGELMIASQTVLGITTYYLCYYTGSNWVRLSFGLF